MTSVEEPDVLAGRYRLGELIGFGGMAEVHRASDLRLGRDVAVKILRADLARDPTFQVRFRREAQAAASLNHPSIVAVYDTGEDRVGGTALPFIVMEYVEGRTLRDVLVAEGRLQPRRALEVMAEVCAALAYAHSSGIVHRDVKPGNVMLNTDGAVKVMDFGIARALTASQATMTQTAAVIGTAQYLSPEQARGDPVDARSDIYALGCVLYELLTGTPPFTGDSPVSVAYQHVREDPLPPSTYDPDLDPALDAIVLKAMAKNPDNRYQDALEMRADLERARAGHRVLATPVMRQETTVLPVAGPATAVRRSGPPTGPLPPVRTDRRGLGWLLGALAVLAVFAVAVLATRALIGGGSDRVTIPTTGIVGAPLATAEQRLEALDLRVRSERQPDDAPVDQVVAVNPPQGTPVEAGSEVVLTVSAGSAAVQVPDVAGRSQAEARRLLEAAGLGIALVEQRDANVARGAAIGTEPAAGTTVGRDSDVRLFLASGNAPLPDVVGQSLTAARSALTGAGFTVRTESRTSTQPAGSVLDQNPDAGTAPQGSAVTLVVAAAAPPPPSPSPSPPPPPPPSPSPSPSARPTSASPSPTPSRTSASPTTSPTTSSPTP